VLEHLHVHLLAFLGVATLLTVTPGPDMAVVTRITLARGRRSAMFASVGITTGLLCWAVASAVGLAALLSASATAYTGLKLVGACYLIWLGVQTWRQTYQTGSDAEVESGGAMPSGHVAAYRQGLLSNLLNPKIAVFYTTFLPQFIEPGSPILASSLLLAGVHIVLGLIWLTLYVMLVARAGDVLRRPRARNSIQRVTGTVLIGFGLRMGLSR
jgi:RhtB (resistance to homoserine/threonine) family protein